MIHRVVFFLYPKDYGFFVENQADRIRSRRLRLRLVSGSGIVIVRDVILTKARYMT